MLVWENAHASPPAGDSSRAPAGEQAVNPPPSTSPLQLRLKLVQLGPDLGLAIRPDVQGDAAALVGDLGLARLGSPGLGRTGAIGLGQLLLDRPGVLIPVKDSHEITPS